MSNDGAEDDYQTAAFLYCYRTFTKSSVVLDKLLQRFHVPPPRAGGAVAAAYYRTAYRPAVQLRVCDLLSRWIQICPSDLSGESDAAAARLFDEFTLRVLPQEGLHAAAEALRSALQVRAMNNFVSLVCSLYSRRVDVCTDARRR